MLGKNANNDLASMAAKVKDVISVEVESDGGR